MGVSRNYEFTDYAGLRGTAEFCPDKGMPIANLLIAESNHCRCEAIEELIFFLAGNELSDSIQGLRNAQIGKHPSSRSHRPDRRPPSALGAGRPLGAFLRPRRLFASVLETEMSESLSAIFGVPSLCR